MRKLNKLRSFYKSVSNLPILNFWNYLYLLRFPFIIVNPFKFIYFLIFPNQNKFINVRTPIGNVKIKMRNRESARTLYSIFIRKDYPLDKKVHHIIDLGSNIGISAIYFLTRNKQNSASLYEADPRNLSYLKENLAPYIKRSNIQNIAVNSSIKDKTIDFFITDCGKYSSLIYSENFKQTKIKVNSISLNKILEEQCNKYKYSDIILKVDLEGIEMEIIKTVNFDNYKNISKLIIEGRGFSKIIRSDCTFKIVNGYVEIINLIN